MASPASRHHQPLGWTDGRLQLTKEPSAGALLFRYAAAGPTRSISRAIAFPVRRTRSYCTKVYCGISARLYRSLRATRGTPWSDFKPSHRRLDGNQLMGIRETHGYEHDFISRGLFMETA